MAEFKGKEITGGKQVSAMIRPEIYIAGRESGLRWAYLIEMGLKARENNLERNRMEEQVGKLQRANNQLQAQIFKLNEEIDALKAGIKPCS